VRRWRPRTSNREGTVASGLPAGHAAALLSGHTGAVTGKSVADPLNT
jgi:hypothetical protein